ncbi:MAG: hypothetical protein IBX50_13965 [Marinospirillum sp.]|uniref:hypothetical protein n=1 Tax=Marinospirillum sp. TaxID=2183934 RepID=UPI0019EAEE60|nr:hypothetical protein [Marinospirillum sp.]MBE0507793.1 hypothetical protein [Marinospirillum sp.]
MSINNPVLGVCECPECGGQASVMQSKRRGRHLYTNCSSCGLDQRTGAEVQNRLWHGTEWKTGVDPMHHRPSSVVDGWKPKPQAEPQPSVAPAEPMPDWSPDDPADQQESAVKPKSGAGRALVALGLTVATVALVLRAA